MERKYSPLTLINLEPEGELAKQARSKIKQMKNPVIVDKSTFRLSNLLRYIVGILLFCIGFAFEKYLPGSEIFSGWKTGGVLAGGGGILFSYTFFIDIGKKILDLYERYEYIKLSSKKQDAYQLNLSRSKNEEENLNDET
jgi:hypothetical protein